MRAFSLLLSLPVLALAQINGSNGALQRQVISVSQAQTIISAAIENATSLEIPENIAVVDPSGHLVAFHRMDNAFPGSIDISQKKARTTVLFNGAYSTADLYAAVQPGAPLYGVEHTNGGLVAFGGGVPVFFKGQLIGGVGVSGGSVEQDLSVALAGVKGLSGASPKAS
jgi:uncharacterized protein GlcG (DUF336 family)